MRKVSKILDKIKKFFSANFAIILILALAFAMRSMGRNWDSNLHLHPDERFITMVLNDAKLPSSFAQYMDPQTSPLSPFNNKYTFYVYGGVPLTIVKYSAVLLDQYFPQKDFTFNSYDGITQLGRFFSTLFDVGVVYLVYSIGTKVINKRVGIISAMLYSMTVLSIQQSNFFTMDIFALFFMMLAARFGIALFYSKKLIFVFLYIFLTGIATGFAIACKVSAGIVLPLIFVLFAGSFIKFANKKTGVKQKLLHSVLVALIFFSFGIIYLIASYAAVRIGQPFVFADNNFFHIALLQKFIDAFKYQYQLGDGTITAPYTIQWYTSIPFLSPLLNLTLWSLGLGISVAFFGGVSLLSAKVIKALRQLKIQRKGVRLAVIKREKFSYRSNELILLVFIAFIVMVFVYYGVTFVKYQRYFLPLIPFVTIIASYFVYYLSEQKNNVAKWLLIFIVIISELWAFAFVCTYLKPNTRITASTWFNENVSSGKVVGHESWDDQVPFNVPGVPSKTFKIIDIDMYADDNDAKIKYLYDQVSQVDYLVLASSRESKSVGNLPNKYPITTRYYKDLFAGKLGFYLVDYTHSFPSLLFFDFNDESAEESLFVYDHPSIWIFEKNTQLTYDQFHNLLSAN